MSLNSFEKSEEKRLPSEPQVAYQTPQELFSFFQIPDIQQPPTTTITANNHQQKLQNIKPNIIQHSTLDMQSTKVIQPPGKPLLVQGPASHPQHFYLMNQPNNGFFGYQPPPMPTNIPQSMYSLSPSPFLDSRYIYSPHAAPGAVKKDPVTPSNIQQNEIKVLEPLPHNSAVLRQSCATIQGQMAANQIPLCLVQDSQGQLHQLVYTVPEELYEKYVAAAKKGFKVKVQPHIESLKNALSNATTTPTTSVKEEEESKVSDEDLKLVKEIKLRGESHTISNKINKAIPLKTDGLEHIGTNQAHRPTHDLSISLSKQIREIPSKTTATQKHRIDNPSMSSTSNDVLSLIKNSAQPCDVTNLTKHEPTNQSGTDLVTSSTILAGILAPSSPPTITQTFIHPSTITQKAKEEDFLFTRKAKSADATLEGSASVNQHTVRGDLLHKTTTTTTPNEQPVDEKQNKSSSFVDYQISPSQPSSNNELFHNINTIDSILAKNENALIPKSDVEALLRCLKRKLEKNDVDDVTTHTSSDKRQKMTSSENRNTPIATPYVKCNSFDYETLDMLSPESLPGAESPCNSVSSLEMSSVSSLEMSNDLIIPSVSSSIDVDIFDTSRMEVDKIPNLSQNDKLPNTSTHVGFDLFDNLRDDLFTTDELGYQDILPTSSNRPAPNTQEKVNRSNSIYSTDHFSFPSGQQNYEMDLFDHLWGELDGI